MTIPGIIESCVGSKWNRRRMALQSLDSQVKRAAVAKSAGLSTGGLANLINGNRRITDFQWTRLTEGCKALGVTLENHPPSHR